MDPLEKAWQDYLYWDRVCHIVERVAGTWLILVVLGTCFLLSACTTGQFVGTPQCGSVHEFSAAWQAKLEQEIAWVSENDPIYEAVMDDKHMRDQARACWEATRN